MFNYRPYYIAQTVWQKVFSEIWTILIIKKKKGSNLIIDSNLFSLISNVYIFKLSYKNLKSLFDRLMISARKKQISLCKICHMKHYHSSSNAR